MNSENKRGIRSFVLRQGRLTQGQEKALLEQWPAFGLEVGKRSKRLTDVFGNNHPVTLEIGFGMGDSLATQATNEPTRNFIGVEVHRPGVGHLLMRTAELELQNLRIFAQDSLDVLRAFIPDASLDRVQVFFPDPWPKKRHHKRRLVKASFAELVSVKLAPGGILHFATDWVPYAEEVAALFSSLQNYSDVVAPLRVETKFERRGKKLGHKITDLAFRLSERVG